jgi:DNA-binding NarL/FixJ family response regulator
MVALLLVRTEDRHRQLASATNEPHDPAPRPHSAFTVEESIVMRAFAAGKNNKQVCTELRIPLQSFHRLLRNLMEKTGTCDQKGLLVWALR